MSVPPPPPGARMSVPPPPGAHVSPPPGAHVSAPPPWRACQCPPPPNRIRLGFKTKADARVFVEKGLSQLKDLGYAFKTEGTKDRYWDQRGSSTSGASIRTSTSWSTKGSKTPTEKDDHVVLVDIPEYLPPNEILSVVKHALTSRCIPVEDTQVSLEKLRWSMGDIW